MTKAVVNLDALTSSDNPVVDRIAGEDYQFTKLVDATVDSTTGVAVAGGVEANALRVTLPTDGTGQTISVGKAAENAAASGNPVLSGGRYDATPRVLGDGDVGAVALDAAGIVQIGGTVALSAVDNTVLDNILVDTTAIAAAVGGVFSEDDQHTTGDGGVFTLAVRNDALAALAGTDGDYAGLQVNANGALYTEVASQPGSNTSAATAFDSYTQVAIALTTGANQVLVSSAASKQIWVYGYAFTCGDADGQTVQLEDEDDVDITGIMEFAQYGGIAVSPSGNFEMPVFKLGTDKDLEIDITGGDVDGWLTYALVSV